jgi:hypothetical protein
LDASSIASLGPVRLLSISALAVICVCDILSTVSSPVDKCARERFPVH